MQEKALLIFKIPMIMNALSDQIRYLNPPDHHPARITKAEKYFTKRLDFKDIKFPVKPRDSHKIEKKKKILLALAFLVMETK